MDESDVSDLSFAVDLVWDKTLEAFQLPGDCLFACRAKKCGGLLKVVAAVENLRQEGGGYFIFGFELVCFGQPSLRFLQPVGKQRDSTSEQNGLKVIGFPRQEVFASPFRIGKP